MPKRNFDTSAILQKAYPLVEHALKTRYNMWKKAMNNFILKRQVYLFDTAPCDRIYYTDADREELFNALGIGMHEINNAIRDTYYYPIAAFKPSAAKDETTIVCMCIVRYFFLTKNQKDLELAMVYQAFSGKYYPSIHYGFFKTVAPSKYRHVMDYVVNNKLSNKYDLKTYRTIIGVIKSINNTWCTAYSKQLKDFDDEDITYMIDQLHSRIKSFMKNIASLYYEAYESGEYMTYDRDSIEDNTPDGTMFQLSTNDSFKLQMYVENAMNKINTSQIDYGICKLCADGNIKVEEVRSIIEAILNDTKNIPLIKEYITCIIASYLEESSNKDINSAKFLSHAIKAKPNSKNPAIIRSKEIQDQLLDDNSVGYRKRKHRVATRMSYCNAFATYFAIITIRANS